MKGVDDDGYNESAVFQWVVYFDSVSNSSSLQGAVGPVGPAGESGNVGSKGDAGPPGKDGDPGIPGPEVRYIVDMY